MPKETKITCDYCKEDLTSTGSMPKWRLHLFTEEEVRGEDYFFCNLSCLASWISDDKPSQEEIQIQ